MLVDVLLVLDQLVLELLLQVDALVAGLRQAVDGVHHEVEAVQVVQHRHVEGRGDGAFFLVAADVDVVVVGAAVGQPVDQPRIGMEGEDDRLVLGEELVEIHVAQPVRMLGLRLQLHEVDDVDHPDFQLGQMLAQDGDGGERLQRGHVAAAGHDHVGRDVLVVAGPLPDADALGAVLDGGVHRQPLRRRVFARDHDVDVMAAAQAVIHHRQQAVGIRRQIDAHDLGLLVHDVVDEAGVLMREAVVILAPDVRGQQVVQRGDLPPPRQVRRDLQPLGVLVEHRIDDVDERLVAVEEPMPPGEQVAFEPAFALVLAEHFHHAPGGREKFVVRHGRGVPLALGHFKEGFQAVGERLVGAEDPEIPLLLVQLRHIAQETARAHACRRCRATPGEGTSTA